MWTKICLSLGLCLTSWIGLIAQYSTGLLVQDNYATVSDYFHNTGAKNTEPAANLAKISLRAYCPRPRIQGEMASCSGWAAGYAAHTIARAVHEQWPQRGISPSDSAYSALFVYNQVKVGSCAGGSSLIDALNFLQKSGNVPFRDFDVQSNECYTLPAFALSLKAQKNRIKDYYKVFTLHEEASQKIAKVKYCLQQQRPVIVAMNLLENFKLLRANAPIWFPKIGNASPIGAHAMVVVGYDDTRKAFEIMNSWGEAWGEQGFGWIRYEDFASFAQFGFVLSWAEKTTAGHEIYGNILLRRLLGVRSNVLLFDTLQVKRKNFCYQVTQPLSKTDKFQLLVEHHPLFPYVYAFSFFEKLPGQVYSIPKFRYQPGQFIIPDAFRAIQFTPENRQWLVLCFSKTPLQEQNWAQQFICGQNCPDQLYQHWRIDPQQFFWLNHYAAGSIALSEQSNTLLLVFEIRIF